MSIKDVYTVYKGTCFSWPENPHNDVRVSGPYFLAIASDWSRVIQVTYNSISHGEDVTYAEEQLKWKFKGDHPEFGPYDGHATATRHVLPNHKIIAMDNEILSPHLVVQYETSKGRGGLIHYTQNVHMKCVIFKLNTDPLEIYQYFNGIFNEP